MSLGLQFLTTLSLLSLTHSIYSAYESTSLQSAASASTSAAVRTKPQIPLDIQLQTLLSTFALLACIVFSSAPLKPIRWAEWAGGIEKSPTGAGKNDSGDATFETNPYRALEERRGFWDVRAARKDFAEFIREGDITSG